MTAEADDDVLLSLVVSGMTQALCEADRPHT